MKKIAVFVLAAAALFVAVPAQAAPSTHPGSFTLVKYGPNFKHRVFLRVESSHGGDKTCQITLNGRTQSEDLGTNGETETFNMFYLRVAGAAKAADQAKAAPSPTSRIICSH